MAGWIEALPEDERDECISALVSAHREGDDERLGRLLAGWKGTAEVWADPELVAMLRDEHQGPTVPLPRPILV